MLLGIFVENNYYHRTSLVEWNPLTTGSTILSSDYGETTTFSLYFHNSTIFSLISQI